MLSQNTWRYHVLFSYNFYFYLLLSKSHWLKINEMVQWVLLSTKCYWLLQNFVLFKSISHLNGEQFAVNCERRFKAFLSPGPVSVIVFSVSSRIIGRGIVLGSGDFLWWYYSKLFISCSNAASNLKDKPPYLMKWYCLMF